MQRPPSFFKKILGVVRTPSNRSVTSLDRPDSDNSEDGGYDGGHSEKHPWNRSFSFLRRNSSKKRKKNFQADTTSLQSMERQDFSSGLKPEHAAGHQGMPRAGSDMSIRSGNKTPSLPTTPISPRSPIMPRAFHSPTSSPLVGRRSQSPRRGGDYGFASAVTNIVDQAHYISEQDRLKKFGIVPKHDESLSLPNSPQSRRNPLRRPPLTPQQNVIGSPLPSPQPLRHSNRDSTFYRSTSLETRSRSPSPNTTPSQTPQQEYYGTANLTDRSRSPSPASTPPKKPVRKLPAVPLIKPSTLNLAQPKLKENLPRVLPSPTIPKSLKSPGNINFPRLNASPTHKPKSKTMPPPISYYPPPPPGKLGRPEPYSPTERNNLNKISAPSQQSRTLPQVGRRLNTGEHWNRDRSNINKFRASSNSPDMNKSSSDRTKFLASDFEDNAVNSSMNRGNRHSPTVPNGVQPKTRKKKTEKLEMRSDSNIPLNESDDSESDWC